MCLKLLLPQAGRLLLADLHIFMLMYTFIICLIVQLWPALGYDQRQIMRRSKQLDTGNRAVTVDAQAEMTAKDGKIILQADSRWWRRRRTSGTSTSRTSGTTGTPTTSRTSGTTGTPTTSRTSGTTGTPTSSGPTTSGNSASSSSTLLEASPSGTPPLVLTTASGSPVEDCLRYSYVADGEEPTFVSRSQPLFSSLKKEEDYYVVTHADVESSTRETDEDTSLGKSVETELGLSGSLGAFSMAASFSTSKIHQSKFKTFRRDHSIRAYQYDVFLSTKDPYSLLSDTAKKDLLNMQIQKVLDLYGPFFARKVRLGGMVQETCLAEMTKTDTKETMGVKLGVSASFTLKNKTASIGASFGSAASSTALSKKRRMYTTWKALGGNSSIWLQLDKKGANLADVQRQWAESVSWSNLYQIKYELSPIWTLLPSTYIKRAQDIKAAWERKWKQETAEKTRGKAEGSPPLDLVRVFSYRILHGSDQYSNVLNTPGSSKNAAFLDFQFWAFKEKEEGMNMKQYFVQVHNSAHPDYTFLASWKINDGYGWQRFSFWAYETQQPGTKQYFVVNMEYGNSWQASWLVKSENDLAKKVKTMKDVLLTFWAFDTQEAAEAAS